VAVLAAVTDATISLSSRPSAQLRTGAGTHSHRAFLLRDSRPALCQIISAAAYGSRPAAFAKASAGPGASPGGALAETGRRDDNRYSRDRFSPGLCNLVVPLSRRGRRESRAPTAPAAPCAMVDKNAHGLDRYSRDIPAFPAQRLYGLYVLSPVSGLYCHRCRPAQAGRIDARVAAPGPHDFAVRCRVFVRAICTALTQQASIATRANVP
jgi:hypothetical protein